MRLQHLVAAIARKPPIADMVENGRHSRAAADGSTEIVP